MTYNIDKKTFFGLQIIILSLFGLVLISFELFSPQKIIIKKIDPKRKMFPQMGGGLT